MKTTIGWIVEKSRSTSELPDGQNGYRLVIEVTEATNISDRVFMMQREAVTAAGEAYEDTFYSVASVADLEDHPQDAPSSESGFYRTNKIDLMFRNMEDLKQAEATILQMLNRLIKANDFALELLPPVFQAIPESALWRYWGASVSPNLTDEEIQAFSHEAAASRAVSKELDAEGPRYFYLIYRAELGEGVFTLDGAEVAMTLETRDFTNADGHKHSYRIYRTTATWTGNGRVLATT